MKYSIITAVTLSVTCASAFAIPENETEYSSSEYCAIEKQYPNSVSHQQYVKAYADKLGFKPSRETCAIERKLQQVAKVNENKQWDYHFNRPYRGSAIRLSNKQVEMLRQASKEEREALLTSIN